MTENRNVGVIGLGKMGLPIAGHLVRAGHRVAAFDVDASARVAAERIGADVHETARSVAEVSDAILVVVGSTEAAVEVCLDDSDGVLVRGSGKVIIVCSTLPPKVVWEIAASASAAGVHVLDTPMARGEPAAQKGTLLILGSGCRGVFDTWSPVLSAFGSDVVYLGEAGAGQLVKSINNYLLWSAIVATYEGMLLAAEHGVDLEAMRAALAMSSGASYAVDTWQMGRDMPWAEKDMRIILEAFEQAGLEAPLSSVVNERIAEVKRMKAQWQADRKNASMDEFVRAVPRAR